MPSDVIEALRLVQHKGRSVVVSDIGIPVSQLERVGQRAADLLGVPPETMCLNGRIATEIGVMLAFIGGNMEGVIGYVPLVKPADTIATAWRRGSVRDEFGKPHDYDRLDTIRTRFGGKASVPVEASPWSCPPGLAAALATLDETMRAMGSRGVRLVELGRSWAFQAAEREKYDTWVASGRPEPTSARYVRERMRSTFLARPGESFHQAGCAIDIDVDALDLPGVEPREQLAAFWALSRPLGFRPIIAEPDPSQSECWHFDWWPDRVRCIYGILKQRDRLAYAHTALAMSVLTRRFVGRDAGARMVQARLLVAGHDAGWTDGVIGPRTLAGLASAGVTGVTANTPSGVLLAALDERGIGIKAMGEI